jgi:hypothetical protein
MAPASPPSLRLCQRGATRFKNFYTVVNLLFMYYNIFQDNDLLSLAISNLFYFVDAQRVFTS